MIGPGSDKNQAFRIKIAYRSEEKEKKEKKIQGIGRYPMGPTNSALVVMYNCCLLPTDAVSAICAISLPQAILVFLGQSELFPYFGGFCFHTL